MLIPQKDNTDYVKKYRSEGLNIIPCRVPKENEDREIAKLPAIKWKEFQEKIYDAVIDKGINIAIICGKISGNLVVIDVDKNDLDLVNEIYPDALKKTRVVKTGRGRYHIYFYVSDLPKTLRLNKPNGDHIDVQSNGAYVVAPPSIHPNGQEYKIVSETQEIKTVNFQDIVVNLEKAGFKVESVEGKKLTDLAMGKIKKGDRHNSAMRYCHLLFYGQRLDQETIRYEMIKWNKTLQPPMEDDELKKIVDDCIIYQKENPKVKEKEKTDKDSHDVLARNIMSKRYFKTLRETKEIVAYEHGVYARYGDIVIEEECQLEKPDCYNNLVAEVTGLIRRETYTKRELFDKDINLLNLENGILNITNNSLIAHSPDELFRVQLPLKYNPDAKAEKIMKFLKEILDPDYIEWVLDFIAYCLVKNCKQEKAMMFVGIGGNGKSTLARLIFIFLGGFVNVSSHSIYELISDRFAAADLDGKLANIHPDIESDEIKRTGIVKALISGDSINVQKKNQPSFPMISFAKHIFSANTIPDVDEVNDAFFQRWLVIDFNRSFRGTPKENKNLSDEITTPDELSGLLNIVMKRMPKLLKNDVVFKNAPNGQELRRVWKDRANSVESFINNQIEFENGVIIIKKNLFEIYQMYCKKKKLSAFSEKTFSKRLKNSLVERIGEGMPKIQGKTTRVWTNIKVKDMPTNSDLVKLGQKKLDE